MPPRSGYLMDITGAANFSSVLRATSSPHSVVLEPGTYAIQLRALSEHYPSDIIGPVNVTVRGKNHVEL